MNLRWIKVFIPKKELNNRILLSHEKKCKLSDLEGYVGSVLKTSTPNVFCEEAQAVKSETVSLGMASVK